MLVYQCLPEDNPFCMFDILLNSFLFCVLFLDLETPGDLPTLNSLGIPSMCKWPHHFWHRGDFNLLPVKGWNKDTSVKDSQNHQSIYNLLDKLWANITPLRIDDAKSHDERAWEMTAWWRLAVCFRNITLHHLSTCSSEISVACILTVLYLPFWLTRFS